LWSFWGWEPPIRPQGLFPVQVQSLKGGGIG